MREFTFQDQLTKVADVQVEWGAGEVDMSEEKRAHVHICSLASEGYSLKRLVVEEGQNQHDTVMINP